jgi:hypothetical protein
MPHYPTNRVVLKALTACIEKRWKPVAAGASIMDVPFCQLCTMTSVYHLGCDGCPLHIYETMSSPMCHGRCSGGTAYTRWGDTQDGTKEAVEAAEHMVKTLEAARTYFFGDQK